MLRRANKCLAEFYLSARLITRVILKGNSQQFILLGLFFVLLSACASLSPTLCVYMDALNSGDPVKVTSLYQQSGVHVNAERTAQGPEAILNWYNELFRHRLPNARFALTGSLVEDNLRTFN